MTLDRHKEYHMLASTSNLKRNHALKYFEYNSLITPSLEKGFGGIMEPIWSKKL